MKGIAIQLMFDDGLITIIYEDSLKQESYLGMYKVLGHSGLFTVIDAMILVSDCIGRYVQQPSKALWEWINDHLEYYSGEHTWYLIRSELFTD